MVSIDINNSYSKINNLASGPFNKLRKALSYSIDSQAAFFSNNRHNTLRYCIDKQGVFATGLLNRVLAFCKEHNVQYTSQDHRVAGLLNIQKVNHKPSFGHIKPYPWQERATEAFIKSHRMIVSATTGSGKSLVIALIASRMSVRTLVVVPSLQIKEQLTESLSGLFKDMSNITVENIDSGALKKPGKYDLLIIDEAHHVAAKTYQKLNKTAWKDIYYRAFLTATPFRNQTEETLLFEGIAGSHIFKLTYAESVKNKYIVPIEVYTIEVPKQKVEGYTWQEVYSELVVNNKSRNEIIAKFLLTLQLSGASTLCLVKEIKHGNNLEALTGLPFANGQDESTRQYIDDFNKGKIKVLIGTEGVMGEGVDTKPCEFVIIAGLGKAKSAFMQKVGRAVRTYKGKESGKVILFLDKSHKFTRQHYKTQCMILKDEYNTVPLALEIG